MKTEPTELNKKEPVLAVNHMVDWTDQEKDITTDICYKWLKIAFKEGQSNPKIKQLEWERNGPIQYVNQYNPIGYTAAITKWAFGEKQYSVRLGLNDSNNSTKFFNSLEEAKDFVQQDFEKRVKECLITE